MLQIIKKEIKDTTEENLRSKQTELAHEIVKKQLGIPKVTYEKAGRPVGTSETDISISHTNNKVIVGITKKPCRIGVDIENINRNIESKTFKDNILNPSEQQLIKDMSDLNLTEHQAVIVLWSIKESYFKACNIGLIPKNIMISRIKKDIFSIAPNKDNINPKQLPQYQKNKHIKTKISIKGSYVTSYTIVKPN